MAELTPKIYYEKIEDVIFIDYLPGTILTQTFLDDVINRVGVIAGQLPHKVFSISNLRDVKISPDLQPIFAEYTAKLLKHVRGVIRYDANQLLTNVTIRTTTVTGNQQNMDSHLYPSRESAVAAVRLLLQAEKSPPPTAEREPQPAVRSSRPTTGPLQDPGLESGFHFELNWDPRLKYVHASQKGYSEGDQFPVAMQKILELLKEHQAHQILLDLHNRSVFSKADQTWLVQEWLPVVSRYGSTAIAYVMPEKIIAQLSFMRLIGQFQDKRLAQAYFDDEPAARQWLAAQPV